MIGSELDECVGVVDMDGPKRRTYKGKGQGEVFSVTCPVPDSA
jgi:hypothetical protein